MSRSIKWIIGLDAHSRICEACVTDLTGAVIKPVGFQTSAYNLIKSQAPAIGQHHRLRLPRHQRPPHSIFSRKARRIK